MIKTSAVENQKENRPFLMSERLSLVPVDPAIDAEYIYRWLNDPEVTYFMFYGQRPLNIERARKFLEAQDDPQQNMVFMVVNKKNKRKIGFAGLYGIDWIGRRAEFRILVGEKAMWGQGYGTEVTELLTWFGFDRLNMHRLDLGVTSENKRGSKAYERAGYIYEFSRKDFMYRNGRYYDADYMAIFRDVYEKKFAATHAKRFGVRR